MNDMLLMRGLHKNFGERQVLSADFFSVAKGECALVFGANGGGKTTLLKIIAGLLPPSAVAEWSFNGQACAPSGRGLSGVVLLHQTPFMFSASVRANVALAAPSAARAHAALEWAGLARRAEHPADKLSGGERARVSLARARAASPQLCLMDEPAAHLDADGLQLVAELIADLRDQGASTIIAAPARETPIAHDRSWCLHSGRLEEAG